MEPAETESTELYMRFLAGDETALTELIGRYREGLTRFLNGYVHNQAVAEELMTETFVRLVVRRPRFSPRASFKTWLYTIGRRLATDHLRRAARTITLPPEEWALLDGGEQPEQCYLRSERQQAVRRGLEQLCPDYRQALYLAYFEGFDNRQIAAVTGWNRRQVENRLYRAKGALKAILLQEGLDDADL